MRLPPQPERYDRRAEQQRSQAIERGFDGLEQLRTIVTSGVGIPSFNPSSGRAIYVRLDGGTNTTLYVWEGAAWVAK